MGQTVSRQRSSNKTALSPNYVPLSNFIERYIRTLKEFFAKWTNNNINFKDHSFELFVFRWAIRKFNSKVKEQLNTSIYFEMPKEFTGSIQNFLQLAQMLTLQLKNGPLTDKKTEFIKKLFFKYCLLDIGLKFTNENTEHEVITLLFSSMLSCGFGDVCLECLRFMFDNNFNWSATVYFEKLISVKQFDKKHLFIELFKELFKKINLNTISRVKGINDLKFLHNILELREELIMIKRELFKQTKNISYFEELYELDMENKEVEGELLYLYSYFDLMEKYCNLYVKRNANKLDSLHLALFQTLRQQNKRLEVLEKNSEKLQNDVNYISLPLKGEQHLSRSLRNRFPGYCCDIITMSAEGANELEERLYTSEIFSRFGLKWALIFILHGTESMSIGIHLDETKFRENDLSPEKEITSVVVSLKILNFNGNILEESSKSYDSVGAYGFSKCFYQNDFVQTNLGANNFVFKFVVVMKLLEINFRTDDVKQINFKTDDAKPLEVEVTNNYLQNFPVLERAIRMVQFSERV
ncbi:hypothetical protein ABK040_012540 [Willaertia magna]